MSNSSQIQQLEEIFQDSIKEFGAEIYDLSLVNENEHRILRLMIEHPDGVNLDLCSQVSRKVSLILDVEDPLPFKYTLEVSSPGIFRELKKEEHFKKHLGERVQVTLKEKQNDKRKIEGLLKDYNGEQLILSLDDEELTIKLTNIKKTKLLPEL